jgi:phenolic acid decarboxylase
MSKCCPLYPRKRTSNLSRRSRWLYGVELTHWTGQQLAMTYVIPMFAGEEGHAHSPVTFKQWITDHR